MRDPALNTAPTNALAVAPTDMLTSVTTDVLVVGGGPAGSSTAWHLAQRGVRVTLVDRAHFPRDKACAEYLSPEAGRILHAMGALATVEQAGAAQLTGMLIKTPLGATIRGEFAASHGFRGFRDSGVALPRIQLDTILLECARSAGVTVVEGAKVEQLLFAGTQCTGARVRLGNALRDITARVVVGADGLRSVVSRRLGLSHTGQWPRRFAFVAHYTNVAGIGPLGEMHVTKDGYVGLANVGNGLTNVALVMPRARGEILGSTPDRLLADWLGAHKELSVRFRQSSRVGSVKVTGPFASHAKRACAPGAALVGDAADFFDPFTGEGIYAALRGGELLAPYVHQAVCALSLRHVSNRNFANNAKAAFAALREYDTARRRAFQGKWRVEKLIGLAVAYPWLLERAAVILERDAGLADLLIGVAGDFVPPRELLRAGVLRRLLFSSTGIRAPHHAYRS